MNDAISNNSASLSAKIEAILFWKAEPISVKKLAALCKASEDEIKAAVRDLAVTLAGSDTTPARGLSVIEHDGEVTLGTAPAFAGLIESMAKDELMRDLGKAGLETLSIILYQGPITRAEIDYIRGVNSQFIVRNLLVRGLIEKKENPKDQRSFLYVPTLELIAHLGLTGVNALPEYEAVRRDIEAFKTSTTAPTHENPQH